MTFLAPGAALACGIVSYAVGFQLDGGAFRGGLVTAGVIVAALGLCGVVACSIVLYLYPRSRQGSRGNGDMTSPFKKARTDLAFHLRGLVDANQNLESLLSRLDRQAGDKSPELDQLLAEIEVELFTHIQYHLDEASEPLTQLLRANFGDTVELYDSRGDSPHGRWEDKPEDEQDGERD